MTALDFTSGSRYVLYDSGAFVIEYAHGPRYAGSYREERKDGSGAITFAFADSNLAGPWDATGTLRGDRLTVRYNLIMALADFEDAVYTLTR